MKSASSSSSIDLGKYLWLWGNLNWHRQWKLLILKKKKRTTSWMHLMLSIINTFAQQWRHFLAWLQKLEVQEHLSSISTNKSDYVPFASSCTYGLGTIDDEKQKCLVGKAETRMLRIRTKKKVMVITEPSCFLKTTTKIIFYSLCFIGLQVSVVWMAQLTARWIKMKLKIVWFG